ncbi:MAG: ParD-like family protein [Actinobacteria bacterium]|nr:ParD-like family protein [Actinomycetota bacterium]
MAQLTLRLDDDLVESLKARAREEGRSVNALATSTLRALVDPDLAGDEADRLRERLKRAGLLSTPPRSNRPPQDPEVVARARAAAGKGRPLSDYVREDRG